MAEEKKPAAKSAAPKAAAAKPAAKKPAVAEKPAATKPTAAAAKQAAKEPVSAPKAEKPAAAPKSATVATEAEVRGYRKARRGYVVSDKMQKTIVVEVEDRVKHPLYGKVIRRSNRIKAHDENNTAGVGDLVLISETRPLSATKNWRLVEIIEKAK